LNAYILPVTCADVANVPEVSRVSENPVVLPEEEADPIWPVIAEVPVVVTPVMARITYLPAVPRGTQSAGAPVQAIAPNGSTGVGVAAAASSSLPHPATTKAARANATGNVAFLK
jgi:hypothetical protein